MLATAVLAFPVIFTFVYVNLAVFTRPSRQAMASIVGFSVLACGIVSTRIRVADKRRWDGNLAVYTGETMAGAGIQEAGVIKLHLKIDWFELF